MNGIIILDKESGVYSRNAGARVARMFGEKKFGHIGTLDPMATGVLPIAIGNATKMIPYIEEENENRNDNAQGIVIDGDDDTSIYSCGVSGHRCHNKEAHNITTMLENKGCHHCGSHSCKSFYTTDEWGNACYDETKCPQYNVKKDPLKYCQDCGKPVGTGGNGTCVHFTVDTKCPDCNEPVKARTCHSH